MGSIIGEIVEGVIRGISGAVTRQKLGDSLISAGELVHRGQLVSDKALESATKTLELLQNLRAKYKG